MIGDTTQGYIVAPVTHETRWCLKARALLKGVALDGVNLEVGRRLIRHQPLAGFRTSESGRDP